VAVRARGIRLGPAVGLGPGQVRRLSVSVRPGPGYGRLGEPVHDAGVAGAVAVVDAGVPAPAPWFALLTRSGTPLPSPAGSPRAPLSTPGPRRHVSATAMLPPPTRNTWPLMPADSALASQVTSGATLPGALGSQSPSAGRGRPPPRFSVMRVRAPGAMALAV